MNGQINTQGAIDRELNTIDPEGVPYKIDPEEREFSRFTHEGVSYCYAKIDFNDIMPEEKETPEFFEAVTQNGKLKLLKAAELSGEIKNQALNGTIKCEKTMYSCIPDDGVRK